MSRQSEAKRARRRKRQAARQEAVAADETADAIAEAIADIDEWITARGWALDAENSRHVLSWVYPPSAATFDDEDREPVTRVWITLIEDDDQVVLEFGAALVGARDEDGVYLLDPDSLADDLAALEDYRDGSPRPELA
jgi:hypothetical protein